MRRPHSGFPSSSRRSITFFAAVSLSVIIQVLLRNFFVEFQRPSLYQKPSPPPPSPSPAPGGGRGGRGGGPQTPAGGEKGHVFERGAGGKTRHQECGLRHILGPQHARAVRRVRNGGPAGG